MNKLNSLKSALSAREDEILSYQINIDNFTRAITKIEKEYIKKPGMKKFCTNLKKLLQENETEQLKAIIIRDVILDQINEMNENK